MLFRLAAYLIIFCKCHFEYSMQLSCPNNIRLPYIRFEKIPGRARLTQRIGDSCGIEFHLYICPRAPFIDGRHQISITSFSFAARISSICFTNLSTSFCTDS